MLSTPNATGKSERHTHLILFFVVAGAMATWQYVIRSRFGSSMNMNFYFQETSSDSLMQTVEISRIVDHPLKSLWYLHVHPPLFDFIRFLLVLPDHLLGNDVTGMLADRRLYTFYVFLFSCASVLVYSTVRMLAVGRTWSIILTVAWTLYPGNVAMATYLDSTYLSAVLLLLTVNRGLSWLKFGRLVNATVCFVAILLLSWTRTLLQIYVLVPLVVLGSVYIIRLRKPRMVATTLVALTAALLILPIKQFVLFGSFSTSTFVGAHQLGLIQYEPSVDELSKVTVPSRLLTNAAQFESKYNSVPGAVLNYRQEKVFRARLFGSPVASLQSIPGTIAVVARDALSATQEYQPNPASSNLPLSASWRWLFSGWRYALLVVLGAAGLIVRPGIRRVESWFILACLIVVGSQILVGALRSRDGAFTWTEADRLKFIIEPVLFCVIGAGFARLAQRLRHCILGNR